MKPINIFSLTRLPFIEHMPRFEQHLSHREKPLSVKSNEIQTLCSFVEQLLRWGHNNHVMDDYYYSFQIPKIDKEFDLLRIGKDYIINIELKSDIISDEDIIVQLQQNRYFLRTLQLPIFSFTYTQKTNSLVALTETENNLVSADFSILHQLLQNQNNRFTSDIESLFCVSNYLISPLNTPDRFLQGEYFLNSHQREIENNIFKKSKEKSLSFAGITGIPGTGKTLLLYDIAKKLSCLGKVCIIHCAIMPYGLRHLNDKLSLVDIVEAKRINKNFDFSPYSFILIDESHRIHLHQFDTIIQCANNLSIPTIFSYDAGQTLSKNENSAQISQRIEALPSIQKYKLTKKIRTNPELASFIQRLLDLHSHEIVPAYPSVSISYANNESDAQLLLGQFRANGYTFINFSGSNYYSSSFDIFSGNIDTHHVIGQEFDAVLMVLNKTFSYDEDGKLRARIHPNPDYLYRNLLYQGLSRVREKLALIVIDNPDLFIKILSITQR